MKNFMVANLRGKGRYDDQKIQTLLKAQIENSIEVGWSRSDIIVLSNFEFEYMGVRPILTDLNKFCWTGSKMFGMKYLMDNNLVSDGIIWARDLDAWQGVWFEEPDVADVGASYYSRPTFNGGSVFWRLSAKDIVDDIVDRLVQDKSKREEPTLNEVFKSEQYSSRVTVLNCTYNVGCSGYVPRYERSIKPIRVYHFHPYNRIAWETHCLDRNGLGEKGLNIRLEKLIRRHYPNLATELSEEGKLRAKQKREDRMVKK